MYLARNAVTYYLQQQSRPTEEWGKRAEEKDYQIGGEVEGEEGWTGRHSPGIIEDHDNKITTLIKEHKEVISMNRAEMDWWKYSYAEHIDA